MDGTIVKEIVRGWNGNLYIYADEYYQFCAFIKDVLGEEYAEGQTYYFAAQSIAIENSKYVDSEISVIGTNGLTTEISNKLATPDNTQNKLIAKNGNYLEIDRAATMFEENTDHVVFYIYKSATADKSEYVGQFILTGNSVEVNGITASVKSMDGTIVKEIVRGWNGNLYIYTDEYYQFCAFVKEILGNEFAEQQTYYFAAQSIATKESGFKDSEISAIGTNGFTTEVLPKANEIVTPDNTGNKLIKMSSPYVEIDRSGTTMFGNGVDYVVFYLYTSPTADKSDFVGQFILTGAGTSTASGMTATVKTMDGTVVKEIVRGSNGNLYIYSNEFGQFYDLMKTVLGSAYNADQTYYFAAQSIAKAGSNFNDSEISAIGTNGFKF